MIDRGYIAESQSSNSSSNISNNQTESSSTSSSRVERTLPNIIKMEIVPNNEIPVQDVAKKQLHQLRIQLPSLQLSQATSYNHQQNQNHPILIHQQKPSSSTINQHHHHQIIQTTTNQQQIQHLVQQTNTATTVTADQIRSPNSVTVVVIKTMLPDQ